MEKLKKLKFLVPYIKIGLIVLVLGYVLRKLYMSWDEVAAYRHRMRFDWLALSSLFYMLAYAPCAVFWKLVLERMGQKPSWLNLIRAYYIGHLGKYTPGKAMVVLMRTDMIRGNNVRTSIAAASVFFETFTMMAAGAFVAAFIMLFEFRGHESQGKLMFFAFLAMILSCLPIFPPFFRFLAKKLGVGKGDPDINEKLSGVDFRTLGIGFLLMFIAWIGFGLSLWATVKGIGIDPGPLLNELPLLIAAVAFSVVLGFVSMIPGGFGVRDWALMVVMGVYFTQVLQGQDWQSILVVSESASEMTLPKAATAAGLVVAALQRAVTIIGELLFAAILYPFGRRES